MTAAAAFDRLRASKSVERPPRLPVVLINLYELGRQPFGLAEPAAWLTKAGCEVNCLDISLQRLDPEVLAGARLVAIYLPMHTATRIAVEALPRLRALAPDAHLCAYGLYAPMNAKLLRSLGFDTILGGECEPDLVALALRLRDDASSPSDSPVINLSRIDFLVPDRAGLPPLARYASLILADGNQRRVGFTEASRGCKHLCRHCPVVPVYQGHFRIVPVDIVLADIRQQVEAGAEHISFGDPDFFNGPRHAVKIVEALHAQFPQLSYDATIKIQHLLDQAVLLPILKETGCVFITSAVESVDDEVLQRLAKHHTRADFVRALALTRASGIALAPTFVAFTPWTTLEHYVELLRQVLALGLIDSVPPVQLTIRLLVPQGSLLLELAEMRAHLGAFDPKLLGYSWIHPDPRVDRLQQAVQSCVEQSEGLKLARQKTYAQLWHLAHEALAIEAPTLPAGIADVPIPRLSEPWFCCAEPTRQQLQAF